MSFPFFICVMLGISICGCVCFDPHSRFGVTTIKWIHYFAIKFNRTWRLLFDSTTSSPQDSLCLSFSRSAAIELRDGSKATLGSNTAHAEWHSGGDLLWISYLNVIHLAAFPRSVCVSVGRWRNGETRRGGRRGVVCWTDEASSGLAACWWMCKWLRSAAFCGEETSINADKFVWITCSKRT